MMKVFRFRIIAIPEMAQNPGNIEEPLGYQVETFPDI